MELIVFLIALSIAAFTLYALGWLAAGMAGVTDATIRKNVAIYMAIIYLLLNMACYVLQYLLPSS